MTLIKKLTDDVLKEVQSEYNAPTVERILLTEEEIVSLAEKLNEKINIPYFSEKQEGKILVKIVLKVDAFLYDYLPNEFYDLVRSVDNGIDDEEAKRLIKRLSALANKKVDIPFIPESLEYMIIRLIIGVIVNGARKNLDFTKANEKLAIMNAPNTETPLDKDLEEMIIAN